MKTSLTHLPERQRTEIEALATAISKIRHVDKIILFGSFARGNYVLCDVTQDDWGTAVYQSDYDIMVIINRYSIEIEREVKKKAEIIKKEYHIDRPIQFIVEGIAHVNTMLEENRYLYADIISEGVILFDRGKKALAKARKLTSAEKKVIQQQDYDIWIKSAHAFFRTYTFNLGERELNLAAFHLHQTTERYLIGYVLVKTAYRPKTHSIIELWDRLKSLDTAFVSWFDLTDEKENRHLELLEKMYVDSRYAKSYRITESELQFIEQKVVHLRDTIVRLCQEEMAK